ncbi:hypothetical protein [Candidatus Electronema sp. PJ]|uniref:hypothetical protein n=1 Tax=Candidatus Electronema sp. PJ TaxID=3401572 RepID=UPI003AA83B17
MKKSVQMRHLSCPMHPLNPSWQALSQIDSVSKEILDLAIYLLQLGSFAEKEIDDYMNAGVSLDSHILGNNPMLDTALDLLGIPSDNTAQIGQSHENSFCRDYIKDVFIETIVEKEDYASFLKEVTKIKDIIKEK